MPSEEKPEPQYESRRPSQPFFQPFKAHPYVTAGMIATTSIVVIGVLNVGKNPHLANKLMWTRIGLQAFTICLAIGSVVAAVKK